MSVGVRNIRDVIEPVIQRLGFELWDCQLHQQGQYSLLRIYIDGLNGNGVTLADCQKVSYEVGAILEVENAIKNRYHLEISSPGLERNLITLQHFQRYVGRTVKIKLRIAHAGKKQVVGQIEKVVDGNIFLKTEDGVMNVTLDDIQRANLQGEK